VFHEVATFCNDLDYEWSVSVPEILHAWDVIKLCKLEEETRREWGEEG